MNTLLIILAFLCLAIGIAGAVVPGLPGPPISWAGLLIASLSSLMTASATMLIVTAIIATIITVLDYVVPSLTTKLRGGSKYGIWGCNIGLILSIFGLPFGPQGLLGVIFWPFVGALIGEYIKQRELEPAFRAATGAFLGFLTGTLLKLVYCVALLVIVIAGLF